MPKAHIFDLPFDLLDAENHCRSDKDFFAAMHAAAEQADKRGKVRRAEYTLWTAPETSVYGWKFHEWDYGKEGLKLSSNARGLFSTVSASGKETIAVRGYDKFFSLNELSFLNWDWIESSTKGPYEVTSKENGCIIFVSGLEDGTLIVTSKQSTGPRGDVADERNHSYVGQQWVRKHLASKNIAEADFAKLLYQLNATAVGELCDDTFEEHVLAYPPERAGIYLHGLNLNVDKFTTYPSAAVEKFAKMFGFLPTPYVVRQTAAELRTFLETCAETGTWNGMEVEGFVVRTKAQLDKEHPDVYSDYFFKYKFEEPYLMYRQWREVTRAYLTGKPRSDIVIKKHPYYTNKYLDFVIPLLSRDEDLANSYRESHGIIKVRQMFLDKVGISGTAMVAKEEEEQPAEKDLEPKYILVPVSTIGCGKTTVAVALQALFPEWGHVQNDDIVKRPKPINFARLCMEAVRYYRTNVVIADRNNSERRERAQVFSDMNRFVNTGTRNVYICLSFRSNFGIGGETAEAWDLTTQRVFGRGDNHQSISAATDDRAKVTAIMKNFVTRFQPVDPQREPDSQFDCIIDLTTQGKNSSRTNLETIVRTLHKKYPEIVPQMPTKDQLDAAFEKALAYVPEKRGIFGTSGSNDKATAAKKKSPRYFAIRIEPPSPLSAALETLAIDEGATKAEKTPVATNMIALVEELLAANPQAAEQCRDTWTKLKSADRVQSEFHVTLIHISQGGQSSSDKSARTYFDTLKQAWEKAPAEAAPAPETADKDGFTVVKKGKKNKNKTTGPTLLPGLQTDIVLKNLYWTPTLMGVEVEIRGAGPAADKEKRVDIVTLNSHAHITIGTISSSVAAVQAGKALAENPPDLVKLPWNIEPRVLTAQSVAAYY